MNQYSCAHCGGPIERAGATGPVPTYCSSSCRDRASYQRRKGAIGERRREASAARRAATVKKCAECQTEFTPTQTTRQKYCSKHCLAKATRDSTTRRCAVNGCDRFVRAQDLCSTHYNRDVLYRGERLTDDERRVRNGDPVRRTEALREKSLLRKSVTTAPDADPITRDTLGDRDGWVCGICNASVDRSLEYPDDMSVTIDHIVPIAHGGRHTWANTQISHFICNMQKGDSIAA